MARPKAKAATGAGQDERFADDNDLPAGIQVKRAASAAAGGVAKQGRKVAVSPAGIARTKAASPKRK